MIQTGEVARRDRQGDELSFTSDFEATKAAGDCFVSIGLAEGASAMAYPIPHHRPGGIQPDELRRQDVFDPGAMGAGVGETVRPDANISAHAS